MKKYYSVALCVMSLGCHAESCYHDASTALCFDEKELVSIRQLQELDMLATFEQVYEVACEEGQANDLPQGFLNCLEILRSGDDRVKCHDLLVSMRLVFYLLVTMRSATTERQSGSYRWLYAELEDFSHDVIEELWDIWRRLDRLEEYCGLQDADQ